MSQTALPPMPWMACKVEPPNTPVHGIGLTPDGSKLWITSVSGCGHYVLDTVAKKLSSKIGVGACPNWLGQSAGPTAATCRCQQRRYGDDASILDARAQKEIARIKVGTSAQAGAGHRGCRRDQLTEN